MSLRERIADLVDEPVTELTILAGGASYETLVATTRSGRRIVIRHAPREDGRALRIGLDLEAELLRRSADLGVPVPVVLGLIPAGRDHGPGLVVEHLDGETLGRRIARTESFAAVRPKLAAQCGTALARIHAVVVDDLDLDVVEPTTFITETHERYRELDGARPILDGVARWLLDHAPASGPPCLVHGDFRNGNLMIHPEHGIVGVLDWELAHLGDPMRDLGYLLLNSWRFGVNEYEVGGFGDREQLIEAYEAETGSTVDRDRVGWWQTAGSFWWAMTCLLQGSRYRPGADGPLGGVEFPAIGRRVSEAEVDCANLIIPGPTEPLPEVVVDLPPGNLSDLMNGLASFLRTQLDVGGAQRFLARVGANSAEIAARDSVLGPAVRRREGERIQHLLGAERSPLPELRRRLGEKLWNRDLAITDPAVAHHLRTTAAHQLAIDQPRYVAPPIWEPPETEQ